MLKDFFSPSVLATSYFLLIRAYLLAFICHSVGEVQNLMKWLNEQAKAAPVSTVHPNQAWRSGFKYRLKMGSLHFHS